MMRLRDRLANWMARRRRGAEDVTIEMTVSRILGAVEELQSSLQEVTERLRQVTAAHEGFGEIFEQTLRDSVEEARMLYEQAAKEKRDSRASEERIRRALAAAAAGHVSPEQTYAHAAEAGEAIPREGADGEPVFELSGEGGEDPAVPRSRRPWRPE